MNQLPIRLLKDSFLCIILIVPIKLLNVTFMRKNYNYYRFRLHKHDLGIGQAISGGAQAAGNVTAATIAADATKHASDQSLQGQREANQTNIDIMRETNAQNLQLSQMQNQWNIEQWQRENEYNSPSNQMKLYKQAGLNPVMAQGQFTPAQHLESAPLAVAQPTTVQNPAADSANIKMQGALAQSQYFKDLVGNAVDVAKGLSDIKKTTTDIDKTKQEIKNVYLQNKKLDIENYILDRSKSGQVKKVFLENKKLLADSKLVMQSLKTEKEKTEYQKLLNGMQKTNNDILQKSAKWLTKKPEAEVKSLIAHSIKAAAEGKYQEFLNDYARKNNRSLPSNTLDVVLQSLADSLQGKFGTISDMVNNPLGTIINMTKDALKNGAKSVYKMADNAFDKLIKWAEGVFPDE